MHVHDARRYVADPAGLMSATARDTIDAMFGRLEASTGIEVAVVVLPSIGGQAPFDFAQSLFRHWGIGKGDSNNGLLILYVADQRSIRMHTGYGIEGFLTDAKCKRIQSQLMVPAFRRGDINGGMVAGAKAVCAVLDGTMQPDGRQDNGSDIAALVMLLGIVVFVLYMSGVFGLRKKRCPYCGKRALNIMSRDRYRAINGHLMRKDVYVCGKCGRIKVVETDELVVERRTGRQRRRGRRLQRRQLWRRRLRRRRFGVELVTMQQRGGPCPASLCVVDGNMPKTQSLVSSSRFFVLPLHKRRPNRQWIHPKTPTYKVAEGGSQYASAAIRFRFRH